MADGAEGVPQRFSAGLALRTNVGPRRRRVVKGGGTVILHDKDNTANLLAAMPAIRKAAVDFGAAQIHEETEQIFEQESNWKDNDPITIRIKKHDKVMEQTGELIESLQVRTTKTSSLPGRTDQRAVGWFDEPHKSTDGRLTHGALAAIHEFGGEVTGATGFSGAPLPARPWLSQATDNNANAILDQMEVIILGGISRFAALSPIRI